MAVRRVAVRRTRLLRIQDEVNIARPGDTGLIAGGQYRESVTFPHGGRPDAPITVRAVPGHIVRVMSSRPLPQTG